VGGDPEREPGVTKNGAGDSEMTNAAKSKAQQFIRREAYLVQTVDQLAIISSGPCTDYPQEMTGLYLSTDLESGPYNLDSLHEPELTRDLLPPHMK